MSQTPCIPTLDASVGIITSVQDIVAYVIRHILSQPVGATNLFTASCVSFRELYAKYHHDKDALAARLQNELGNVFSRYFPNNSTRVEVTATEVVNAVYNLEIRVYVTDEENSGKLVLTESKVKIGDNGVMDIAFTGAKV